MGGHPISLFHDTVMSTVLSSIGLSALADKTGIVSTKSKDKFCRDKFLSCLRCPHSNFQSGQILSTALIIFLCRARQNIEHFGGIMDHVQILVLVAFFCASKSRPDRRRNAAYNVLVFTASISSNQAVLLMVEHCRRRPA